MAGSMRMAKKNRVAQKEKIGNSLAIFLSAGCFGAPSKDLVQKTATGYALETFDSNLRDIDKITIDNTTARKTCAKE